MRVIVALLALGATACPTRDTQTPEPAEKAADAGPLAEPVVLPWEGGLPLLTEIAPEPKGYDQARTLYRTATVAIAHGDFEGGTRKLLDTAKALTLPAEHPHRRTYDAARCMIYQNAAATWAAAKQADVAAQTLTEIKAKDPACGATIDYALGRR